MKYSSTVRLINTVIFALLLAGFASLGIYFGFVITPNLFYAGTSGLSVPNISYALSADLGVLGIAGGIVSLVGLGFSVKSLVKGNDDKAVVSSFASYIAVGLTLVGFLFLNATWLYRLTSTNLGYSDLAFVIIVYVIAMILILFASLVPLVRLFGDNDKYHTIMRILSGVLFAGTFATGIVFLPSYINVTSNVSSVSNGATVATQMLLGTIVPLVAAIVACVAFFLYGKSEKKGVVSKRDGFLFECALCLSGASIVLAGIMEYINQKADVAVSFIAPGVGQTNSNYVEFLVMSIIVGGVIILASIYFAYQTALGSKAKVVKED